jgi:transcriptional regulator with XRE-family HTH domain
MIASAQVKAARKLLRWSQMKLAFEANVAPSTIVNIEGGKKRLSPCSASRRSSTPLKRPTLNFLRMSPRG